MKYNYYKKSIWKWILLYIAIGVIVYGLGYYFFLVKNGWYNYQDQTNNWEVYENNTYHYEIRYPKDWALTRLSALDLEFSLGKNNITDGADIYFELVSETRQIDSVDRELTEIIKQMRSVVKPKTKIKIGNYDGYEVIGAMCTSICTGSTEDTHGLVSIIYFSKDDLVFEIQYLEGVGGVGTKEEIQGWKYYSEFKEILSTLKFADSISDRKTYKSDQYGFEIKIPSNWIAIEKNNNSIVFTIQDLLDEEKRNQEYCQKGSGPCIPEFTISIVEFTYGKAMIDLTEIIELSQINFNGFDWTRYKTLGFYDSVHYRMGNAIANNIAYDFEILDAAQENLLKQIVSTFKLAK